MDTNLNHNHHSKAKGQRNLKWSGFRAQASNASHAANEQQYRGANRLSQNYQHGFLHGAFAVHQLLKTCNMKHTVDDL